MPFPFSTICTLLSRHENIERRDPPYLHSDEKAAAIRTLTESWFKSHRHAINALNPTTSVALLSALLPERRTDRVYGLQHARLCRILARALGLSATRSRDLHAYTQRGKGDLAECLQRVLASGGPPAQPAIMLDEVDEMLQVLAGGCRFSDRSKLNLPPGSSEVRDALMGNIFKRAVPEEGKWLVRLLLKDFSPVCVNEQVVLRGFHFLLPGLLQFQNDFDAAVALLKGPLHDYPSNPDPRSERLHRQSAARLLRPAVGVKVGRPTYHKARSIDHCMKMLDGRKWVLERKYDGEYCEVHIDLTKSSDVNECITIFSKSGKNSTDDRRRMIPTLVECFRLGKEDCKITSRAIVLGEMIVYSDRERIILPFEHIRKHVTRSGRRIGVDKDSVPGPGEHLGMVFFDILLLDNHLTINESVEDRRLCLRKIYQKMEGRAMGAEWKVVDFEDAEHAKTRLVQQFAASIAQRCEGLVLKPCDVPYFPLEPETGESLGYIKLKKDYIDGLGDEADFAIVGASYDAQQALKCDAPGITWTSFHLGCLVNKGDVLRADARPRFKIVGTIAQEHCIPQPVLEATNRLGMFLAKPYESTQQPEAFDVELPLVTKVDVMFTEPLVFEVLGSGFAKPSNSTFLMLRHPRVRKLHQDRTWRDCVSLQELQEQGTAARDAPPQSESQETRRWIDKLASKVKKKFAREKTISPRTEANDTPRTVSASPCDRREHGSVSSSRKLVHERSKPGQDTLDGTTLVEEVSRSSKRKGAQDTTPCHAIKRRCLTTKSHAAGERTSKFREGTEGSRTALLDITNSTSTYRLPRSSLPSNKTPTYEIRHQVKEALDGLLHAIHRRGTASDDALSGSLCDSHAICRSSSCLFNNSVVFLNSCISQTPYIVHDLLHAHDIIRTPSLTHWDRAAFTHGDLQATVSESQAYDGMRKLVLVEAKRSRFVEDTVRSVLRLNSGMCRERVEVYDWRVLERCGDHRLGVAGAEAKRFLLGATVFDESCARARFVTSLAWADDERQLSAGVGGLFG